MAFAKEVTVPGDTTYQISPAIKKYTLLDLGFIKNNAGAYVLHRSLEADKNLDQAIKLKVSVNPDLTGFKMSTVSAADTVRVNIFDHAQDQDMVTLYRFFVNDLIKRGVLEKLAS
ncbi:cysteine desulfurase [Leuconostocaceae bacterium ESL0723]|nr:cysteine desulfurase [Leuconostocaceae bacterium ESL0723]